MQDGLPPRQRMLALLAIGLSISLAVLDGGIVNVALPSMARDLAVRPSDAIFVVNGYQIAVTIALLPLASLGDSLGYRRVYLGGLAVFTLASLGCALAPNLPTLIAARIVQGLGAAGIMSVNIALVRFIYPTRMIGQGMGAIALIVAVASAAGPTIGGAILSLASWPWLFLVNLPLGALALAVGLRTLPASPESGRGLDWPSTILNALTFGLLIVGFDGLGDPANRTTALAELGAALVIGTGFVLYQLKLPAPLLPVDLLRIPVFALSIASSICGFGSQMIAYVALPFLFQDGLGFTGSQTGLLLTPWPLAIALMASLAGRLADRFPPALLGCNGLVTLGCGLIALATMPSQPAIADIVWRLVLCGLGFGLFQAPNNKVMMSSAPRERSGGASGMLSTARLTGQSLGAALVAVVFGATASGDHGNAVQLALWCAVGLAFTGALTSVLRGPAGRA